MPAEIPQDLRHIIERSGGLENYLKAVKKLYANPVGRPAIGRQQCVEVLIPIIREYSETHSDRPLSLYRLIKLINSDLLHHGVEVGRDIDEKTVRDTCKLFRLAFSKNLFSYTIREWKWLIKKGRKEQREIAKKQVVEWLEILHRTRKDMGDCEAIMAKQPGSPVILNYLKSTSGNDQIDQIEQSIKHFTEVLSLFPSC